MGHSFYFIANADEGFIFFIKNPSIEEFDSWYIGYMFVQVKLCKSNFAIYDEAKNNKKRINGY